MKKILSALCVEAFYIDLQNVMEQFEQIGLTGFCGIDDSVRTQLEDIFREMDKYGLNSKQRVELENKAYAVLADAVNMHGTFGEKFRSWRYFHVVKS